MVALTLAAAVAAACAGVPAPASFDCAMRKLAYDFGRSLVPRQGEFESLFYALNLNDPACNTTMSTLPPAGAGDRSRTHAHSAHGHSSTMPAPHVVSAAAAGVAPFSPSSNAEAAAAFPPHAVYVHATDGDDANPGTAALPKRTVQAGVDAAADLGPGAANKTVVLRGGTHFLASTLVLTPRHSHIRVVGAPGERAVVSGGVRLNATWKPFNVTRPDAAAAAASAFAPPPPPGGWVKQLNYNYVWDMDVHSAPCVFLGKTDSASACEALCQGKADCHAWTWHDRTTGKNWANDCVGRTDGHYLEHRQLGHASGHDASATPVNPGPAPGPTPGPPIPPLPPAGPPNVWVADVSGQVDDMPGLLLNGKLQTRARYPNLPWGIESSCGYGCMIPGGQAKWTPPNFSKYGPVTYYVDSTPEHFRNDTDGWFNEYMIGVNGLCSVYDPPVSYWCSNGTSGGGAFAFRTPSGVTPHADALPNAPYKDPTTAMFFVWRPSRWANWMFNIDSFDTGAGTYTFGKGGNQGARGNNNGGDFFVENVREELDYPSEWFFDRAAGRLYLWHNGTGAPPAAAEVVAPQKQVLVNLSGTQWVPVVGVTLENVVYTASAFTYMEPHAVPSAGDWALDRFGAIFLQGTKGVTITNCTFDRLQGNGVMLSGFNRNATVSHSDFSFLGGNAVVAWGYTNETSTDRGRPGVALANAPAAGVDGTDGEHPRYTTVVGNTGREIGLYEKQSSFFIQAKTALSVVVGNVFFNGPRAGINANDGFGGGDLISHNLVFSTCRESGDHGPFNSWDRQPFLTDVRTGKPSMYMAWRQISHNFFIDNYSPQENVDNDDGSCFYNTTENFFVYGSRGEKTDFGGHSNVHNGNVYAYVGEALGVTTTLDGYEDHFTNNYVVFQSGATSVGKVSCAPPGKTVTGNNSYFTDAGNLTECDTPHTSWSSKGIEPGSTVGPTPSDDAILERARDKIGLQ